MAGTLNDVVVGIQSIFDSNGFKQLNSTIKYSTLAVAGFGLTIDRVFNEAGNRLNNFANGIKMIGGDFEKLQSYVNAANFTIDTNADAVQSDLTNLFNKINDFKKTGRMNEGFVMGGISLNQKPEEVLEQIRKSFKGKSNQDQMWLAKQMGVEALLPLLRMTKKEMQDLSVISPVNKEEAKNIIQVANSLKQVRNAILNLKDIALAKVSPALNESLKDFLTWLKNNKEDIINLFSNITKVMSSFVIAIGRAMSLLASLFNRLTSSKSGVAGLTVAFGLLITMLFPIKAAITAVVIALDDLYVFLTGKGHSAIGDFIESLKWKCLSFCFCNFRLSNCLIET